MCWFSDCVCESRVSVLRPGSLSWLAWCLLKGLDRPLWLLLDKHGPISHNIILSLSGLPQIITYEIGKL